MGPHLVHSRRRFLALSGAAAAALSGCGGDDESAPEEEIDEDDRETDVALLQMLLDLEYLAVSAYEYASQALGGRTARDARRFGEHESTHARELAAAIERAGGSPARRRARAEHEAGFPRLRGEREALAFLADVESTAVAAYIDGLPKIATPATRATLVRIVAAEGEHLAVLSGALGRPQAPEPFVEGGQ